MSQVSYGTITIVDTTDIARIYMVYAKSVSNTTPPSDELTWSESIASAPGEGDFIWQKTVVEKAITEEKTYSDPVCVTGSSGQGVEKIINYYCNYGQGQPEEDYSGWQLEIPEYDGNKPNYWTKVVVIYSDDTREDFQANGAIATFESEKVGILDSLEVSLSPIQSGSGTPSPSNVRPISGWDSVETVVSGVNVWDEEWEVGGYAGATGEVWNTTDRIRSKSTNYIPIIPNTTYYSKCSASINFFYYDAEKNYISYYSASANQTFTTPANAYYMRFFVYNTYGTTYNHDISINYPSTDHDYHAYQGHTYTTDLPQTVYGGTLDVVSGVLTVDRAMITVNGTNYNMVMSGGSKRCYISDLSVPKAKPSPDTHTPAPNLIANYLTAVGDTEAYSGAVGVCVYATASANIGFTLTGNKMTLDKVKAYLAQNPLQVVYELATPTTIQCDPQTVQTLIGDNNVWGDGVVELRGHTISKRDVMIYKDNGLTDVVNKSAEANTNAAEALDKANDGIVSTTQLWYQTNSTGAPSVPASHSQVDQGTITYNNWRSARPNNNVDSYNYYYYCYEYLHGDGTYTYSTEAILDTSNLSQYQIDQLQTRVKKIWSNSTGSYMASGINTETGTNEVDIDDSSTYGFNSKSTTTGVSFNYNTIPLTSLGTDGIKLYSPTLTNGVITGSRLDATLSTNGLMLNKGGIKAGEGTSNFIYLSTDLYGSYSINGSTGISDWKQIIGTKFGVRADGTLYASNANIQGILTAGAGSTIGPWSITATSIYKGNMYFGDNGLSISNTFKVSSAGVLNATGAQISGNLAATDGFTVAQNNKTLTSITTNGMIVYDGVGDADSTNVVAKFTNSGARIGKEEQTHIDIKSNSLIEQNNYLNDATESISKTQLIYASMPRSYSSEEGKETIALPYDIAVGSHFIISAVSNGETLTDEIVFAGGRVHTFVWGSGAETEIDYHGGYELDIYHLPDKQTAYVEMSITYESTDGGLYKASEFEVGSKNDPTSHLASLVESIVQPRPQIVELTGGMFVGIRLRYERPVILDSVVFILDSSYTSKTDVTSAFSLRYENDDYNDAGWYLATPIHYPPGSSNEDDIIIQDDPYCIVVSYKAYQPSPYLSFGRNNTLLAAPETVTFGKNNTAEGFGSFVGGIDSKSDKFGDRSFTWGRNLNNYLENCLLIGKYNALNARDGELFVVGGGTSDNDRRNVFTINEVGTTIAKGAIRAKTEQIEPTISRTTGTTVRYRIRRFGNVVTVYLTVRNTDSVAVGGFVYQATLGGIPLPPDWVTTATYYGSRAIVATLSSGGVVYVRNTYSAAFAMKSNESLSFSFTYVID